MENFRLRVFRAVARHLNFRMAAEELLFTAVRGDPADQGAGVGVGCSVIRSRRRPGFAHAGPGLFAAVCRPRLAELAEEAREAVAAATGDQRRRGWPWAPPQTIGQYLLPKLVAGFLREHPRVADQRDGRQHPDHPRSAGGSPGAAMLDRGAGDAQGCPGPTVHGRPHGVRGAHGARMGR